MGRKKTHPTTKYALDITSNKILANKWTRLACQRHLRDLEQSGKRGFCFDEQAANHAMAFFPEFLLFYEGDFDGQPFNLTPHQQFIIGSLFGWKRTRDDFRRFRTAYIEEAKGNGKALALDTLIPTPTGWSTMGAMSVGDQVFDENGNICTVIAISEIMFGHECYRIRFSDGGEIIADAEHLWKTNRFYSGAKRGDAIRNVPKDQWIKHPRGGEIGIRTTHEIARTLIARSTKSKHPQAKWNHRIDIAGPLNLPEKELLIHPYVLGCWLGDGDSDSARITCSQKDSQILDIIGKHGYLVSKRKSANKTGRYLIQERPNGKCKRGHDLSIYSNKKGRCLACERATDYARRHAQPIPKYTNITLQEKLRNLSLLNNKHIPKEYLRASYTQRMALLQGIMDTDGYISPAGDCEITLCNQQLANGVIELIRSLGYKCVLRESEAMLNGMKVGQRWRMMFKAYKSNAPTKLIRKLERLSDMPVTRALSRGRMIVGCDPVPSVPVRCIGVNSKSNLYLAGREFIPTHNTPLAAGIGLYGLCFDEEPGCEVYAAAVTREQAGITFRDARTFAEKSESLREMLRIDRHNIAYISENSFFRPISSEHRGLDGKRPHMALIDEIHEHPTDMVVRKMSAGTKTRRQALIFEITNALAIDTPLPTPGGWIFMKDIVPGDYVYDESGQACKVNSSTEIMYGHECYRVIFDDGSSIVADAGHLWKTEQLRTNRAWREAISNRDSRGFVLRRPNRLEIRNTKEIFQTVKYRFSGGYYNNHRVEISGALRCSDIDLPIDPYFLGCWLGDGNSKDTGIIVSEIDAEILDYISGAGLSIGRRRSVNSSGMRLMLHGIGVKGHGYRDTLHNKMKNIGLLRNKHIPPIYLRASYSQRLALLQGLMDTDGSITNRGRCIFTQHDHELILQVQELIHTLGMKCTVRHDTTKLNGKQFDRWDIHFSPPWDVPIFRLRRKAERHYRRHDRKRMSQSRMIINVVPIESVPVKCIEVSSPSHLYLAGTSMIPTHNSGYDRNSICFQHHQYSEKILEGIIEDDGWFCIMTGLDVCARCQAEGKTIPQDGCPDCDDWRDEKVWIKANPNLEYLGAPFRDYLRRQVEQAKSMPSQENIVKRLNFCCWTESITRWIPADRWNACSQAVDAEILKGRSCYGGLDLSNSLDLTAWVLVFPPIDENGKYEVLCRFFLPEDNMRERVQRDKVPYDVWARQGYIMLTPGNIIDYDFVLKQIEQDSKDYVIEELAFDRWGSQKITTDLQELGFEIEGKKNLVQFGQGFGSMSAPTKELEKMVLAAEIAHGGNPVLSWNVSNVAIRTDAAENKKPDKEKSTERIDGAVALIMAIGRAMLKTQTISIYESMSVEEIKATMSF